MTDDPRQIFAFGGGGFTNPLDAPLVDRLLEATGSSEPRVCLVPTAVGDSEAATLAFYREAAARGCRPSDLPLFRREDRDPRELLLRQDLIWVWGGNTANALAVWRLHGVDRALREAWEAGVVLAGSSAGMLCWFEASITDSFGPELDPLHDGLGFLPGSACPHYDSEGRRQPVYTRAVAGGLPGGYAAEDGVALHFRGEDLVEPLTARPGARAHRVALEDGAVTERPLDARLVG